MKLEKRSAAAPASPEEDKQASPAGGKKPVIIYILILFIAAFMLMALSLLMHQRSSTEALVRLNDSITAMKELQTAQAQIVDLEQREKEAQALLAQAEDKAQAAEEAQQETAQTLKDTQNAMEWFWQLDEAFLREDFEGCQRIFDTLEAPAEAPLKNALTPLAAERYQEIAKALEARNEETAP